MNVKKAMNEFMKASKKKSPAILTGMAVVGVVATAYSAYKAGLVASEILEKHRKKMEQIAADDKRSKWEVRKETALALTPVVLPTLIMGGATIGCTVGAQSISSKRIAALSAAYSVSEAVYNNLNGKMTEILGTKKAREIKDSIAKDHLLEVEKSGGNLIVSGSGNVKCLDEYSGRMFWSNAIKIDKAVNQLSNDVRCNRYVSLNDFYDLIDLPRIKMGDVLGWNEEDTMGDGRIPITFSAILSEEGDPVLCIEYDIHLRRDFRELH